MSTFSESELPSFDTSEFKYTQPPHPSWTFGEPITATEQGKKWAEEEKEGWKTINVSEEDPRQVCLLPSFSIATNETRLVYALCTSGVVPRPVAFVSTIAENGSENLAPFRYACGYIPVSLY
jgi:hypothetical protein